MAELNDYSGPFKADFKPQDLSKDALTRMWTAASFMYLAMDKIWFDQMVKRFGEDFAWELSHKVWSKAAVAESKRCAEALNIRGNDVASCMKLVQVAPAWAGVCDLDFELINNNHCILTVKRCPALDVFEKHNREDRINLVCHKLELDFMADYAHFFNPEMLATPLSLPPRKNPSPYDSACRWEFKLEK
ncbi:MAG: DUF6125 family protein [Dehalococcoidia bacterium]|nr:DUF6125 family protein [Dehalococcoidia bacterium]